MEIAETELAGEQGPPGNLQQIAGAGGDERILHIVRGGCDRNTGIEELLDPRQPTRRQTVRLAALQEKIGSRERDDADPGIAQIVDRAQRRIRRHGTQCRTMAGNHATRHAVGACHLRKFIKQQLRLVEMFVDMHVERKTAPLRHLE